MPASSSPTCSRAPAWTASQPENRIYSNTWQRAPDRAPCQSIEGKETIETIGEIARKTSFATDLGDGFKTSQVPPTTRTGCPLPGRSVFGPRGRWLQPPHPLILLTHPLFRIMGRYHRHIARATPGRNEQ